MWVLPRSIGCNSGAEAWKGKTGEGYARCGRREHGSLKSFDSPDFD